MSTKYDLSTTEGVMEWVITQGYECALHDPKVTAKTAAFIAECVRTVEYVALACKGQKHGAMLRAVENERLRQAFEEFERGYGKVYNVAIVQNLRNAIEGNRTAQTKKAP